MFGDKLFFGDKFSLYITIFVIVQYRDQMRLWLRHIL